MKPTSLILLLSVLASPLHADPISQVLTDEEQRATYQLYDRAVRSCGMECAPSAVFLWNKILSSPRIAVPAPAPVTPKAVEPKVEAPAE
jgi:hypothetical protein